MKVVVAYCFPQVNVRIYEPLAHRFAQSYVANPPGLEAHDIWVISNGGPIQERQKRLFDPVPCGFLEHSNQGKDIGAFQMVADRIACDLLVCFGSHVHPWRPGWLDRIIEAFLANGPALYGAWGFHQPADHIRTTAFWLPPELLRAYPYYVGNRQRYDFEHGPHSITSWCRKSGFPTLQVTWGYVLDYEHWTHADRSQTLLLDQHTDRMGWQ
jgi:hypothetical protein